MTADFPAGDATSNIDAAMNEDNASSMNKADGAATLGDEVQDVFEDVKEQAAEAAGPLKDEAAGFAEKQKKRGADRLSEFASAVHDAADAIGRQTPKGASYIHAGADRLDDMCETMRNKSLDELIGTANDAAHERPLAFFAGSMAAGFALARFLRSSANGVR